MNYEEIAKFACNSPLPAIQKWTEFSGLLKIVHRRKPCRLLEIGFLNGGCFKGWREVVEKYAIMVGLDYGDFPASEIKKLAKDEQKIILIKGDSHDPQLRDEIREWFGYFDFLFIDGDHSYEGVKMDYEIYSPLVVNGGIIAFHDIVEHTVHKNVGVHKFWEEIKHSGYHRELIDLDYPTDWGHWGGIGVLYK